MNRTTSTLTSSLMAAVLMSGCAVTHESPPPAFQAPAAFKEEGIWQQASTGPVVIDAQKWWTVYQDETLNKLEEQLVVDNQTLKGLAAQLISARAAVDASHQAFWPSLSVGPSVSRSRSTVSGETGTARTSTTVALTATANWEIDLWGKLSEASTLAQASYLASAEDLAAARLSAQVTLAQTYFALRTAEVQLALLQRSMQAYQRALELTQARYDAGMASRSDILQAQTQIKSAEAQLAETTAQRAQLAHALAVLVGKAPSELSVTNQGKASLPPAPAVPAMLPSELLTRRPDVRAARHRVESAYAQLGIAKAAYFPSLTLSASAGYRSDQLANLIQAPNLFWSIGPALTEVIFNGGQRELARAQAQAGAEQATANYRQTCLEALQEVEDNLVLAQQLQIQGKALAEAAQHANQNLDIVTAQYQGGTVSYLNVVAAQTSALSSELNLLSVRNRELASTFLLLKNAGGNWSP